MKRTAEQSGQVLVLAVVMLVILILAAIFLFDLHNIIRSKIKLETAEQAAALSAANWQKESLNLIGEINLIKACDVMISDIPSAGDEPAEIEASCKALTEMPVANIFCRAFDRLWCGSTGSQE